MPGPSSSATQAEEEFPQVPTFPVCSENEPAAVDIQAGGIGG